MKMLSRLIGVLALGFATNAGAQSVHGTISESGSGAPLVGAFVVLTDSAGDVRAATLSDTLGRYYLQASSAGRHSLRAELIGHETVTMTIAPNAASVVTVNISLPIAAVALDALEVASARRCERRPESATMTARVWEEARKALTVASWTERTNRAHFEARNFERMLELRTNRLLSEKVKTVHSSNRPYLAAPADTLARYGFVRDHGQGNILFYGPDADVLLSDAFLDMHCLSVHTSSKQRGLIGLAFEPVPGRAVQDITGTLWLDARTSELKFIEFRYTNLPIGLDVAGVGGRTDFRRLPSGAWIVDRWYIRLPAGRSTARGFKVVAMTEGGGEIVNADLLNHSAGPVPKTIIQGLVYDSISGRPLGNALVYLSGTAYRTVADSSGHYRLGGVPHGLYDIAFAHAVFDSLPILPEPQPIELDGSHPTDVVLTVPSLRTLLARICPASPAGGVLVGGVHAGDRTTTLPTEAVTVRYRQAGKPVVIEVQTDQTGRFAMCGLPIGVDLMVTVADDTAVTMRIGGRGYALIEVRPAAPRTVNDD